MVSWSTLQLQQICYLERLVNLNPELIHLNLLLLGLVVILTNTTMINTIGSATNKHPL